jgi:hypothetical protein
VLGQLPFTVYLKPGGSGASHDGCSGTAVSVGSASAGTAGVDGLRCLVMAEVVEVLEAHLANGWDCRSSNGEALSRVLAGDLHPGKQPQSLITAGWWLNGGRPDFVSRTFQGSNNQPGDRNNVANGCGVLFLNWLRFQLGHSWTKIVSAGGSTLAETYAKLENSNDGFAKFRALIDQNYVLGKPIQMSTDNPFPLPATVA